jgi:mono/diheme cytochrome c family protein
MPQSQRIRSLRAQLFVLAALTLAPLRAQAQDELGEQVFGNSQPPCAVCHTLEAAGAVGEIGPNLDELKPTEEQVRLAVTDGVGVMPAYEETLSEAEIAAVSQYVAKAVGTAE